MWAPNCTPKEPKADIDAGTVATRGSRIGFVPPAMSALGQEERFRPTRLSDRCRLGEATFAGTRATGETRR